MRETIQISNKHFNFSNVEGTRLSSFIGLRYYCKTLLPRLLHLTSKNTVSNRSFGFTMAVVFMILFIWIGLKNQWNFLIMIPSIVFAGLAWLLPSSLGWLNALWFLLGRGIQFIVSPVMLALIFYLIIVPIGTLRKVWHSSRKLVFNTRWTQKNETYHREYFKHMY